MMSNISKQSQSRPTHKNTPHIQNLELICSRLRQDKLKSEITYNVIEENDESKIVCDKLIHSPVNCGSIVLPCRNEILEDNHQQIKAENNDGDFETKTEAMEEDNSLSEKSNEELSNHIPFFEPSSLPSLQPCPALAQHNNSHFNQSHSSPKPFQLQNASYGIKASSDDRSDYTVDNETEKPNITEDITNKIQTSKYSKYVQIIQVNKTRHDIVSRCIMGTYFMMQSLPKEKCFFPNCTQSFIGPHFHCCLCNEVFSSKKDAVSDIRGHEKELKCGQLNVTRVSLSESCWDSNCRFSRRQSHYHCLEPYCSQVVLTSTEIQAHYNSHQKLMILKLEGFEKVMISEQCVRDGCPLQMERVGHYHCIRPGCLYSFKTRIEMEKHKGHHAKNEELLKDGFRKFFKYESCGFVDCHLSNKSNHVHCLQEDCHVVVNSMNMILSHKRKHTFASTPPDSEASSSTPIHSIIDQSEPIDYSTKTNNAPDNETDTAIDLSVKHNTSPTIMSTKTTIAGSSSPKSVQQTSKQCQLMGNSRSAPDPTKEMFELYRITRYLRPRHYIYTQFLQNSMHRYTANDACNAWCRLLFQNHYHCMAGWGACKEVIRGKQEIREHGRMHAIIEEMCYDNFLPVQNNSDETFSQPKEKQYMCKWPGCTDTFVSSSKYGPEHFLHIKMHLLKSKSTLCNKSFFQNSYYKEHKVHKRSSSSPLSHPHHVSKRSCSDLKPIISKAMSSSDKSISINVCLKDEQKECYKFQVMEKGECTLNACLLRQTIRHFHCLRDRCNSAVEDFPGLEHHALNFHGCLNLPNDFEVFNYKMFCTRPQCLYAYCTKHFHCIHPNCGSTEGIIRDSTVQQHAARHKRINISVSFSSNSSDGIHCSSNTFESSTSKQDTPPKCFDLNNKIISPMQSSDTCQTRLFIKNKSLIESNACKLLFCKLKRMAHYHCSVCNAGISSISRYAEHMRKHSTQLKVST